MSDPLTRVLHNERSGDLPCRSRGAKPDFGEMNQNLLVDLMVEV
jgi:hypothetical protein